MAKNARDVMSSDIECIGENDTVADAAKLLENLDVGRYPSAVRTTARKG